MSQWKTTVAATTSHLTRPHLQQMIGAASNIKDVNELIVRCHTAARTAIDYAEKVNSEGTARNGSGKRMRITLALDHHKRGRA